MRNITRFLAGAIAGIILTAGTGVVISAIAAKTEVKDVAVRQVIDMSAAGTDGATLTNLQIHPLKGLDLVIQLPEGASTSHAIEVKATYDASHSDAPADGGKVDDALGKVVVVRSTPGDPTSAVASRRISLSQNEVNAGEVDYIVTVTDDKTFSAHTQNGLAYVDITVELSTT